MQNQNNNNNNVVSADDIAEELAKSQQYVSKPPPVKILDQQAHTITTANASSGQLLSQKRNPKSIAEDKKKRDLELLNEGSEIPEDFTSSAAIQEEEEEDPPELKALRLKNPFRGQ